MGKISMWKRIVSLTIVLVLINGNASAVCATTVAKDASQETVDAIISENNVEPERTGGSLYGCEDVTESMECDVAWGGTCWMAFSAFNDTDQAIALTITSSNPAVADVRYPE